MIAQQVAKKYATALFLSVGRRGLIDEAYNQLGELGTLLGRDPALLRFLASPRIEEEQKLELLQRVLGSRLHRHLIEFLSVLVRKRRAMYLADILGEFRRLVEVHKGIARATVLTAVPLDGEEEKRLVATLAAKTGRKIELERKLDRDLIGGMIVFIDDDIIDGSVKHGLDRLEEQLNHIKVY